MKNSTAAILAGIGFLMLSFRSSSKSTYVRGDIAEGMMGDYFSAEEVVKSATASALDISAQFNPPASVWNAAYLLTYYILDPIRHFLGNPVTVESWYRSPQLTSALLSAGEDTVKNTTHVTGGTADLTYSYLGDNRSGLIVRAALVLQLPFDRLLIEHGTLDAPNHIHIEFDPDKSPQDQRRQIWRITHGSHGEQKSLEWANEQYL